MKHLILLPTVAMTALIGIVWVRLYTERVGELRSRRINPQSLATSAAAGQILQRVQASDNFKNLFEVPVLFYVLCGFLAITGLGSSPFFVGGAWLYVALRCVHSYIHLTYNRVMHRFNAYVASTVLLFAMWGAFGVQLLRIAA